MKLERQVCSPELAVKLEELGLKQSSLYSWVKYFPNGEWSIVSGENLHPEYHVEMVSAYTVAELGIALNWVTLYIAGLPEDLALYVDGLDTEANTRAKMLVHVMERAA